MLGRRRFVHSRRGATCTPCARRPPGLHALTLAPLRRGSLARQLRYAGRATTVVSTIYGSPLAARWRVARPSSCVRRSVGGISSHTQSRVGAVCFRLWCSRSSSYQLNVRCLAVSGDLAACIVRGWMCVATTEKSEDIPLTESEFDRGWDNISTLA